MRLWKLVGLGEHRTPHVLRGPNLLEDDGLVEVVPLSEVREALLGEEAVELVAKRRHEARRNVDAVPTWDELGANHPLRRAMVEQAEADCAALASLFKEGA
jgi:hypothetical protein